MRRACAALLGLLILLPISLVGVSQGQQGEARTEWWGPTDDRGWHFRIPVTVTNDLGTTLEDHIARVELDLPSLLSQAGWPSTPAGERVQLQAFRLEEDSIRVVEYTNLEPSAAGVGNGQVEREVPALTRLGWLSSTDRAPYNNATNPLITVLWKLPGTLDPGEKRYFQVYFDATFHAEKPPELPADPRLKNQYYVGSGMRFYGYAEQLWFVGLHDDTSVTVHRYTNPSTTTIAEPPSGTGHTNPLTVDQGGTTSLVLGVPQPVPVVVHADKPVLVTGGGRGIVPGHDGLLASDQFTLPVPVDAYRDESAPPNGYAIYPTGPFMRASVRASESDCVDADTYDRGVTQPLLWPVCGLGTLEIQNGGPAVVQSFPPGGLVQVPSKDGSAYGSGLRGIPVSYAVEEQQSGGDDEPVEGEEPGRGTGGGGDGGEEIAQPEAGRYVATAVGGHAASAQVSLSTSDKRIFPQSADGASFASLAPKPSDGIGNGPNIVRFPQSEVRQEHLPATDFRVDTDDTPRGQLMAWAGSLDNRAFTSGSLRETVPDEPARVVTPYAGVNATEFFGVFREGNREDGITLFAYYDDTRVVLSQPGDETPQRISLSRDEYRDVTVTGAWELTSTKPVAVLPRMATGFLPGVLGSPHTEVGNASFYGPLVSIAPAFGASEPMLQSVGPGGEVVYEFNVTNLARTPSGEARPDVVELHLEELPDGWTADLNETRLPLDGAEQRLIRLRVQPPEDAEIGTRATFKVVAQSAENPKVEDSVTVLTLLKTHYEVGIWYEQVDGPTTQTMPFEPGESRAVPLVIKNLGNAPDQVALNLTGADAGGWRSELTVEGQPADIVDLGAGETERLVLNVSAPNQESASLSTFEVGAASLNSAAAVAKVLGTAKIRTVADLEVSLGNGSQFADPGTTARFPLTLENQGNQAINVVLNVSDAPLPDWSAPELTLQGASIRELSNLVPGQPVTLQIEVPVPPNATAFTKAPVSVRAEAIASDGASLGSGRSVLATTVVDPVRNLVVEPPSDAVEVTPGRNRTVEIPLVNRGNADEFVVLTPTDWPTGWSVTPGPATDLGQNDTAVAHLHLDPPSNTPPGNATVSAEVRSAGEVRDEIAIPIQTPVDRNISVSLPPERTQLPVGKRSIVDLDLENTGNTDLALRLNFTAEPISVSTPASSLDLAPGDRVNVPLEVDLTEVGSPGRWNVTVLAHETREDTTTKPDAPLERVISVEGQVSNLRLDRVIPRTPIDQVEEGSLFTLSAIVLNEGPLALKDVDVELRIDGEPVDRVTLSRVPVDEPKRTALAWRVDHMPEQAEVVVNPDRAVSEPTFEDNAKVLEGLEPSPLPFLAPIVIVLAIGLGAILRRRGPAGGLPPTAETGADT